MATRFQACQLTGSPHYPSAIAWSEENLIAVASGHLVTILNPASPPGPRGTIKIPNSKSFAVGVIERKDLLSQGLWPICLARDNERPCVRSLSWSPVGLSSNAGCLLAVCTADGRVRLYRQPFFEFRAEWVEVMDVSDLLSDYLTKASFGEKPVASSSFTEGQLEHSSAEDLPVRKEPEKALDTKASGVRNLLPVRRCTGPFSHTDNSLIAITEVAVFPCSSLKKGSTVEVFRLKGSQSMWVPCILDRLHGVKAHVLLQETDGNGKQDEWIEINTKHVKVGENSVYEDVFPKIRPSINVGCFPKELLSSKCSGVGEILQVGQAVEAWTNDRWVKGLLMGFDKSFLLVKFPGDAGTVTLDVCSVRLAPSWMGEQNSWQIAIVKILMDSHDLPKVTERKSKKRKKANPHDNIPTPQSKSKAKKISPENPPIPADQYVSRIAKLSSLTVSWLPVLRSSSQNGANSLLAVGGKSGEVSFYRACGPYSCYSVEHNRDPTSVVFAGLIQAHNAWVTAISWALFTVHDGSRSQVLLVTGSSDGSVKIWKQNAGELTKVPEVDHASFTLLKEVEANDSSPVSVLSVTVPVQSGYKMFLAVGKGSGTFEVWICDISTNFFDKVGSYNAHSQIVTGLTWALDGCYLHSCSQDNSMRCWILCGTFLREATIPSNTLGMNSSSYLPNVSDSCFGLAVSSGNMVLAVLRRFDAELLDQMYQAKIKAAVEFFWIGGQQLNSSSNMISKSDIEAPGFSAEELFNWESSILCSLKQYEDLNKPLIVWDILTALSAFKKYAPNYVDRILVKWLSISYLNRNDDSHCSEEIIFSVSKNLQKITSRKLHLLNILCRRVVLFDLKADEINMKKLNLGGIFDANQDQLSLWTELLVSSENELRNRLVRLSFSEVLSLMSCSYTKSSKVGYWHLDGLAQMEKWVALNHDQPEVLASDVGELDKSKLHSICDYVTEEQCIYCSAPVPFESPEVAYCQGLATTRHKLTRCAVSMRVCPATPLWFCPCCQRRASTLAPQGLFQMLEYPPDFKASNKFSSQDTMPKPLCPFCGVLQQRLQPVFLLSPSPV